MSACEATSGCYELYSIGSAKFLREIFNSVAMITGSGDFLGACAVAIMLGVILAVIKGIMTGGGKIEVGAIVVSSLVTCIMFVPRATVVVEDVYNGSTYAVDNVPIGVAAPGMFISRVGFTIAELMDQGFSTVDTNFGITNRPFLESTKILSNLRNPQFANSVWDQLGKHTNSDVKRSFYNFFKECTMLKYNFDKTKSVDQDQKMTLENLMDDFQSNVFYTEIYVDGKAVTKTCNDANAILKSKINQLNGDLVNNAMPAPKEYGSNTATEMTDAISMLRLTSADAMEMVKLSIVQPVYDKALAGYFDNSGDVVAALTINNAIQQRNAQWSMEQSLFLNTVRPIITFFEGFVYAVTPFMAILICMGAFGLGIAIKYFQTLIWIQLWMPILAIINLYIYMSAQGAVDSAGIVDKHIDSFYALGTLAQTVETWTSVGGMLAAMTPVIAFFIVAGSAYTFTSIASKLNGADHIDEKAMSPDVLKQAPMFANSKGTYEGTNFGQRATGADSQADKISVGQSLSTLISSAESKRNSASVSVAREIGDMFQTAKNANLADQFVDYLIQNKIHTGGINYSDMIGMGMTQAQATRLMQGTTSAESHDRGFDYRVSGSVSGGANGKGGSANVSGGGSWGGSYTGNHSGSTTNTAEKTNGTNRNQAINKAESQNSATSSGKQNSSGTTGSITKLFGKNRLGSLKRSSNEAWSNDKIFNEANNLAKTTNTSQELTAQEAVHAIGNGGDWNGLQKLLQDNNLGQDVFRKQQYLRNQLGYDENDSMKAAMLMTAINSDSQNCSLKALSMIQYATGNKYNYADPYKYQNINHVEAPSDDRGAPTPEGVTNDVYAVKSEVDAESRKVEKQQQDQHAQNQAAQSEAEGQSNQNIEAQKASQQLNEKIADNGIFNYTQTLTNASYNSNPGRPGDGEFELDDSYESSFNNDLHQYKTGISSETRENLKNLYLYGNMAKISDKAIEDIVSFYSVQGVDNSAIRDAITTLRVTPGFNKEKLTEDIGRMNSNRQVLFFELNKACKNRDILLNQNKELLETAQGFKGVGEIHSGELAQK